MVFHNILTSHVGFHVESRWKGIWEERNRQTIYVASAISQIDTGDSDWSSNSGGE